MSYDLFLMRFVAGEPAEIDRQEFWELLAGAWEEPPDQHGFVRLVRGELGADVYAGQLGEPQDSVMINRFGGDEIMDLIVELAREADAVIIGPDLPPLLTHAEQLAQLPTAMGLGEPVLIGTGDDLSKNDRRRLALAALGDGTVRWAILRSHLSWPIKRERGEISC